MNALVLPVQAEIKRLVRVDRKKNPRDLLQASGRILEFGLNWNVIDTMPRGEGDLVEVNFFFPRMWIYDDALAEVYAGLSLVTDPFALATIYAEEPAFLAGQNIAASWKHKNGDWHYITYRQRQEMPTVSANPNTDPKTKGWPSIFGFAGVAKRA